MSILLHAALCLGLQVAGAPAMRVDWSAAAGADSPIATVRREYVDAVNAGGLTEAFFTDDALASRGSGPLLTGSAALAAPSRARPAHRDAITLTLIPRRYSISGDTGAEVGTFVETVSDGARVDTVEGLYVTIYTRGADGRWRIAMEVRATGSRDPVAVW